MPDLNSKQPTDQSTNQTAPPVAPLGMPSHTDLPPLPDFMKQDNKDTIDSSVLPINTPSNGSDTPIDLPPIIAAPKKKFGGGKIIATILGILVLVGGVGAGLILTQQQQIFNQKAVDNNATGSGAITNPEITPTPTTTITPTTSMEVQISTPSATPTSTPSASALPPANTTIGVDNGSGTIILNMPKMAPNCQFGKFDNASATTSCLAARQYDSGSFTLPTGCTAKEIAITSSSQRYDDYLFLVLDGTVISGHESMGLVGKTWDWNTFKKVTCSRTDGAKITPYICKSATTCTVPKSEVTGNINIVYDQTKVSSVLASSASHTFLVVAGGDKDPESDCAMSKDIQLKLTYTCSGPTPIPTVPPSAPQCLNVKVYNTNWKVLSDSDLSGLLTGTAIKLCVANSGSADKAQFNVNGVLKPETTIIRPGSTDYCQDYTILSSDTTVSVKAKVHYINQGWFGENI